MCGCTHTHTHVTLLAIFCRVSNCTINHLLRELCNLRGLGHSLWGQRKIVLSVCLFFSFIISSMKEDLKKITHGNFKQPLLLRCLQAYCVVGFLHAEYKI